jgi:hypothetical protein
MKTATTKKSENVVAVAVDRPLHLEMSRCEAEYHQTGVSEMDKKANIKQYGKAVADVLEVADQYGMEVTIIDRAAELGVDVEYYIIEVKHECQTLTIRSSRGEGETQRHVKAAIYRWGRGTHHLYSRNLLTAARAMAGA